MKKSLLSLFVFCSLIGQAQFTNISSQFGIILTGNTMQSGCGASMYDFDYDGWDDLTLGQPMNPILVYRNNNGVYEIAASFDNNGDPKSVQWVDYDNDGDADFFFSILNQSCKLYRNDGDLVFTDVTSNLNLPITNGRSFGTSWGDYDLDGFLDVYICNYSTGTNGHTNWLLHNNGDGTFTNVTTAMNVGNGTRPSYQSAWIDLDRDGWLDLYVVNDFDWGNEFYHNDQGQGFTAMGADYGLNVMMEGMSNSWSDFDNDQDFDVIVTNNLDGNYLLRNDDGVMTNIGTEAGVAVNSTCWGSLWMDYDHDGLDDLHISTSNISVNGNQNYLFHNNGDYTFADSSMTGDNLIVFGSTKGDQNNDGYWDFVEMRQYPAAVAIWQNNGGDNHWLKFGLTGTVSNREGIGAVVEFAYPGRSSLLQTQCGEGYLEQSSQYEIISMAEHTVLDSLIITWPSGWVDRHYNLSADQFYSFVEGETFVVSITPSVDAPICAGSSIQLSADAGYEYLWNESVWGQDSLAQSIQVSQPGVYEVVVTNAQGISAIASYVVEEFPFPMISAQVIQPSCSGGSDACVAVSSEGPAITSVNWGNGGNDLQACGFSAGFYELTAMDENGCASAFSFSVDEPQPLSVTASDQIICTGASTSALVFADGGSPDYTFTFSEGVDPDSLIAGEYEVVCVDAGNCTDTAWFTISYHPELFFTALNDTVCSGATASLVYELSGGSPDITIDWSGADPEQLLAGEYTFTATDANQCEAMADVVITESPEMSLDFDVVEAAGGANGSAEAIVSGGIAPFTYAWDHGPVSAEVTGLSQGNYSLTVTDAAGCAVSDEVYILDTSVEENKSQRRVFPNPALEFCLLQAAAGEFYVMKDISGRVIASGYMQGSQERIDLSQIPSGYYMLCVSEWTMPLIRK